MVLRKVLLTSVAVLLVGGVVGAFPMGPSVYGALTLIVFIFVASGVLSSGSESPLREKASPYECGFEPIGHARSPFSLRFFLLAMLFLIFDAEVVLLFPVLEGFRVGGMSGVLVGQAVSFLAILLVGLWYEWYEGSLDWIV